MVVSEKFSIETTFVSDSALRIFFGPDTKSVLMLYRKLSALLIADELSGVENLHPAYESITLDFDPAVLSPTELLNKVIQLAQADETKSSVGKFVEVLVDYGGDSGPDLVDVAHMTGLRSEEVVTLHTAGDYEVAFLGFAPGFPYLRGLNEKLACERKAVPRLHVPAGSVAIGGAQAGIYPEASPGGWQVIGRSSISLFEVDREPPVLLEPGDRVRFIDQRAKASKEKPPVEAPFSANSTSILAEKSAAKIMEPPLLEVISGGFYTTIQDLGRFGHAHLGISRGGAADQLALRIGNSLNGNRATAAALEMTVAGGTFRFLEDAWIAVVGGDCEPLIDGQKITMATSYPIRAGQTLQAGSLVVGARSYLCVQGGFHAELKLGARSTFVSGGWGGYRGRELRAGDRLSRANDQLGKAGYRRAHAVLREVYRQPTTEIKVTRGPQWDWFSAKARADLFSHDFEVTTEANRRGLRLRGPALELDSRFARRELVTEGIANGALQVPASGQVLLLFCEQQTTGGYPKIANVIRADLFRIGQLRPGARFRFRETSLETAWALAAEQQAQLKRAVYAF
jgi:antagonist of KipI